MLCVSVSLFNKHVTCQRAHRRGGGGGDHDEYTYIHLHCFAARRAAAVPRVWGTLFLVELFPHRPICTYWWHLVELDLDGVCQC